LSLDGSGYESADVVAISVEHGNGPVKVDHEEGIPRERVRLPRTPELAGPVAAATDRLLVSSHAIEDADFLCARVHDHDVAVGQQSGVRDAVQLIRTFGVDCADL